MKIIVDFPALPGALAALRQMAGVEVDCLEQPEERARPLDPTRIRDAQVLFCTFPPTNVADMTAL